MNQRCAEHFLFTGWLTGAFDFFLCDQYQCFFIAVHVVDKVIVSYGKRMDLVLQTKEKLTTLAMPTRPIKHLVGSNKKGRPRSRKTKLLRRKYGQQKQ